MISISHTKKRKNQSATTSLAASETGTDVFTYTATNGTDSGNATLTFTVTGINDAPTPYSAGLCSAASFLFFENEREIRCPNSTKPPGKKMMTPMNIKPNVRCQPLPMNG